jgi:hypothetical protein
MEDKIDLLKYVQRVAHGNSLPAIRQRIAQRRQRIRPGHLLAAASLLLLLLSAEALLAARQNAVRQQAALSTLMPASQIWLYDE